MQSLIKIASFSLVLVFCANASEEKKEEGQLVPYKRRIPRSISYPEDRTLSLALYNSLEYLRQFHEISKVCIYSAFSKTKMSFDPEFNLKNGFLPGYFSMLSFEKSPSNKSLEKNGLVSIEGSKKSEMILYNKNWETEDKLTLSFGKKDETGNYNCDLTIYLIRDKSPFNSDSFKKMIEN